MMKSFDGESCSKESCDHRIFKEAIRNCAGVVLRSSVMELGSVERVIKKVQGDVNEVIVLPG